MKVLFRADAGPAIGDGHLMRCFALASALRETGAEVTLLSTATQSHSRAVWQERFTVQDWPSHPDLTAQTEALLSYIEAHQPDVLVIDSYAFDAPSLTEIVRKTRCVLFNDLGDVDVRAALVVNQNAGAESFAPAYTQARATALGPAYACLRPEILAEAQKPPPEREGVLISFGNAQPDGLSQSVLDQLRAKNLETTFTIVAPESIKISAGTGVTHLTPRDLAPLLARARGAIIGGGVTALEAAHLGTPTVILPIADNQRPGARALHSAGSAICVMNAGQGAEHMSKLLNTPRALEQMSLTARRLVDGQGPSRLAALLSSL